MSLQKLKLQEVGFVQVLEQSIEPDQVTQSRVVKCLWLRCYACFPRMDVG